MRRATARSLRRLTVLWVSVALAVWFGGRWAFEQPRVVSTGPRGGTPPNSTKNGGEQPIEPRRPADETPRSRAEWARRGPAGLPAEGFLAGIEQSFSEAEVERGRALFFERDRVEGMHHSCADCHDPLWGWSHGRSGDPHPPAIVNLAYLERFAGPEGWERLSHAVEKFGAHEGNRDLTLYIAMIRSGDSSYDRWKGGDESVLTPLQKKGHEVFGKAGCAECHPPPLFTDGAEGTPTLRGDLEASAPYMNDGRFATLTDVIDNHPEPKTPRKPEERAALLAFLRSLRGSEPPPIAPWWIKR